jgi:outer membrane usher protein
MVSPGLALADDLPPPPTEMSAIAEATLYLDLVVNQMPRAELVPVQQRAGQLYLDSDILRSAGISLPGSPQGEVALESIAGLHTDYDSQNQRLLLQVPPACQTSRWVIATCTRPAMRAAVSAPVQLRPVPQ